MHIGHFQNARAKQRKLVYRPILHELFQNFLYLLSTYIPRWFKLSLQYINLRKEGNVLYIADAVNCTIF